jgi:hypothetical protein
LQADVNTILNVCIGVVGAIAAWQFKRMTNKLEQVIIDVAVLKETTKKIEKDHDTLIVVETKASAAHKRLDQLEAS